jgi:hypothetical protein
MKPENCEGVLKSGMANAAQTRKTSILPDGKEMEQYAIPKKAGRYYASILVERVVDAKGHQQTGSNGCRKVVTLISLQTLCTKTISNQDL